MDNIEKPTIKKQDNIFNDTFKDVLFYIATSFSLLLYIMYYKKINFYLALLAIVSIICLLIFYSSGAIDKRGDYHNYEGVIYAEILLYTLFSFVLAVPLYTTFKDNNFKPGYILSVLSIMFFPFVTKFRLFKQKDAIILHN